MKINRVSMIVKDLSIGSIVAVTNQDQDDIALIGLRWLNIPGLHTMVIKDAQELCDAILRTPTTYFENKKVEGLFSYEDKHVNDART